MSIYTPYLSSIPFKNELYLSRYIKFIEACLEKNKSLPPDVRTEEHHVLPKADSMFPQFIDLRQHPWNAAHLTLRQHFIAHLMLWKAYDNDAMTHSANMMANVQGRRTGSRRYEKLRKAHAAAMSDLFKGKPKKPFSEEHRKNMSIALTGRTFSEETKMKMSEAKQNVSDETKRKLSIAATGRTHSDETKRKMSKSRQGQNNGMFKGFYQTPFGTFESAPAASKATSGAVSKNAIKSWCKKDNLKVISNAAYGQSPFLRNNYTREDVVGKKTFNDLGFYFISS